MLESEKKFYNLVFQIGKLSTMYHLRRRMNPHHSKKDKKYEELVFKKYNAELSAELLSLVESNVSLFLLSDDRKMRDSIKQFIESNDKAMSHLDVDFSIRISLLKNVYLEDVKKYKLELNNLINRPKKSKRLNQQCIPLPSKI